MAKHDGQEHVWVTCKAHWMLAALSVKMDKSMQELATAAIEQYCRRRGRPKAKAGKDQ